MGRSCFVLAEECSAGNAPADPDPDPDVRASKTWSRLIPNRRIQANYYAASEHKEKKEKRKKKKYT